MTRLPTPAHLHEITPDWLTKALQSKGSSNNALVTGYSVERIGEGKGFINQLARLTIEYDGNFGDLPRSVIAKLPPSDPKLKAMSGKLGDDRREIRLYEEIATKSTIQTPYLYYSASDHHTGNAILLLEDMTSARQGDSVAGCSLTEARLAIRELAKFQSAWWESPDLRALEWIPVKDVEGNVYQEVYPEAWALLVAKAKDGMTPELKLVGDRLQHNIVQIKNKLARPPRTIIHGDYRLDNFFLGTTSRSDSLVVFDWEFCAQGRGTFDVATFINEAFPPAQRRQEEIALLRLYHRCLTEHGVENYTFEDCLIDYRISILEIFVFWVVVGGYLDYEGDRASIYLRNSCQRFDATISDLNCTEFLSV
ncbi:MAG: phosphotransferase [Chloroflexota bacterium]|nr:phosphotransferase [Chloroflexota bacterium]